MSRNRFNLNLISRYRTELMGLATIGIIVCHTKANGVSMPGWLWSIFQFGSVGTAIFLFLSGMGIWYSLRNVKYDGKGIVAWYKKRFIKLFVPFLILSVPYFAYVSISERYGFWFFISMISTVGYWFNGEGLWFVSVIVILYLISPWWALLIRKTGLNLVLSVFAFLLILACSQWIDHVNRICFFFLGFGFAPYIEKGTTIRWFPLLACMALLYLICSIVPWLDFFPKYIIYIPFFVILPCIFFGIHRMEKLNTVWRFMGKISLESYLSNVFLPAFFIRAAWIKGYPLLSKGNWIGYLLVIVVGITLAWLVHLLSNKILSKILKK